MSDTTTNPADLEIVPVTYAVDKDVVEVAIRNGVVAQNGFEIGDNTVILPTPAGWTINQLDQRDFEDLPRFRDGTFEIVGVRSLAAYVNRYKTDDTLGWIHDVNGRGSAALVADLDLAEYVIDDLPTDSTSNRVHRATLVLRPTAQARRWGNALRSGTIDQETLLDLVVDGIAEIGEPDGATLRDLVADLHAVRNTSVRSVIRKGGGATVEVADNVALHAGTGNTVTVPETITVVLQPYASVSDVISFDIKIKPKVREEKVWFILTAPGLDVALTKLVGTIAADLAEATGIEPLWVP